MLFVLLQFLVEKVFIQLQSAIIFVKFTDVSYISINVLWDTQTSDI